MSIELNGGGGGVDEGRGWMGGEGEWEMVIMTCG